MKRFIVLLTAALMIVLPFAAKGEEDMAVSNRVHTVDLRKQVPTIQLGVLGIGDNDGAVLKINVLDSGSPASIAGNGITAYFQRSDGTTVTQNGSVSGNTITVSIPEAGLAVPGRVVMAVRAVYGSTKYTVAFAEFTAAQTRTDALVDPGHVVPNIDNLLAQIQRMEQGTASAEAVVATFDSKYADVKAHLNQLAENTEKDIGELKSDLTSIFDKEPISIPFNMIGGIITAPGTSCGVSTSSLSPGIKLSVSNNYNSYYVAISKDTEMWFDTQNASYIAFMVAKNFKQVNSGSDGAVYLVSDNPIRYRKSESNLPSEENKVHLSAGDVIAFTIKNTDNFDSVYGFASEKSIRGEFANAILAQAPKELKNLIQYRKFESRQTAFGYAYELLHIYMANVDKYIRYDFVHSYNPSVNADNWRINGVYVCDSNLNELYHPCASGEWECAVHLINRSDFSGGIAHGDEVYSGITLYIDGKRIQISAAGSGVDGESVLTGYNQPTPFGTITIVEKSRLFDPNDNVTEIAVHGSEHIFADGKLVVNQNLVWSRNESITNCYLAMFTPEKTSADYIYTDVDYLPELITDANRQRGRYGCKKAVTYSDDTGFYAEFIIGEYPNGYSGGDVWRLTDNSGKSYNKQYYYISTSGDVESGTVWRSHVEYIIKHKN